MLKSGRGFRLGFVVNPYAGVGGPVANKGSDDPNIQKLARDGTLTQPAISRAKTFLDALAQETLEHKNITVLTVVGAMGADYINPQSYALELIEFYPASPSSGSDTGVAAQRIVGADVDLLVFVGGDGTARDVCRTVDSNQVVLGVPSGVKMHSGVYAVNPQMAAQLVARIVKGELLALKTQEVRDIDETAFRRGIVKSQYFGELRVPEDCRFVQSVKQGGLPIEELELMDIADSLRECLHEHCLVVMGPGSTTLAIQQHWGLSGTLLGVDLIQDGQLKVQDVDEQAILQALAQHSGAVALVVTAIGGQGHILGRGNQQISPAVLRKIGRNNVHVVATKAKLATLRGRPFLLDSGDSLLDQQWCGFMPVLIGFNDSVLYPVGYLE